MKISYRILAINFLTLLVILTGSWIAFYSVLYNVTTTTHSKHLLSTANEFKFDLESHIEECDRAFQSLQPSLGGKPADIKSNQLKDIDFVLKAGTDAFSRPQLFMARANIGIPLGKYTLQDFFITNPHLLVRVSKITGQSEYLYGYSLDKEYFNDLSSRLRVDLAVFLDQELVFLTNEVVNQKQYYLISQMYRNLSVKGNFETSIAEADSALLISTIYRVKETISNNKRMSVVIFSSISEADTFHSTIRSVLLLLFIVSVILTFILTFVFSGNIRKQLSHLTRATELTKKGDLEARINISTNDEIGQLAGAFNAMLDTLREQEHLKNQYTEFITLINSTPQYNDLITQLLEKIIRSTGSAFGVFYSVSGGEIESVFSYGFEPANSRIDKRNDVISKLIESKETVHYYFDADAPEITAGIVTMKLAEMLLQPVISGDTVIGILQLGAMHPLKEESIRYLDKIREQLIIGITKALSHKKLEQLVHELEVEKKRAEESTELKSKFLAMISHELRTPLNSIMGLAELLSNDKNNTDKTRERVQVIQRSSKRLLKLINEILDMSKIEAGKMDINPAVFKARELIDEIRASFQPLADTKGLLLNMVDKLNDCSLLLTDREKLLQIISNLAGNALKFTNSGSVDVVFECIGRADLVVIVSDTGIGIPKQELELIFNEFHQVDSSSSRVFEGSGLGLSIARRLIELLDGKIEAESTLGVGSKFVVSVPGAFIQPAAVNETAGNKAANEDITGAADNSFFTASGLSGLAKPADEVPVVLIVDDDPDSLYTINEIMKECRFKTLIAKDGFECLEVLETNRPDIILLDIMMPRMDGFQTIAKIKQNSIWGSIPVLAVTAKAMLEDRHIILKHGFGGIVPKPINAGVLAFNVMKLIMKSRNN